MVPVCRADVVAQAGYIRRHACVADGIFVGRAFDVALEHWSDGLERNTTERTEAHDEHVHLHDSLGRRRTRILQSQQTRRRQHTRYVRSELQG